MSEAVNDTVPVERQPKAKSNSKSQSPEEPLEQRIVQALEKMLEPKNGVEGKMSVFQPLGQCCHR